MIVNFVKCDNDDCEILIEAPWMVGGWLLVLDSMLEPYKDQPKRPFVASHITTAFPIPCNKCGYEISGEEEHLGACLVNHGDDSACIHCPKCNTYIPESSKWHNTTWDEDDLIQEEYTPPWMDNEMKNLDNKGVFYKIGELKDVKSSNGQIRDLQ